MTDLYWNIETGDLVTTGSGTTLNFIVTSSESILSTQNGGIMLNGRGMNVNRPNFGIGVNEIMNGSVNDATFQMNRWQAMCRADSAISANWKYNRIRDIFSWAVQY